MRQPVFNSREWQFYGADEVKDFHVTEGSVAVSPEGVEEDYRVAVEVPIELVKFIRDIRHDTTMVELYLDQDGSRWVFGYELQNGDCVDLWHYTANSFPLWANRQRRLQ